MTEQQAMALATAEFHAINAALDGAHVPAGDIDAPWSAAQRVQWLARQYGHFLKQ